MDWTDLIVPTLFIVPLVPIAIAKTNAQRVALGLIWIFGFAFGVLELYLRGKLPIRLGIDQLGYVYGAASIPIVIFVLLGTITLKPWRRRAPSKDPSYTGMVIAIAIAALFLFPWHHINR